MKKLKQNLKMAVAYSLVQNLMCVQVYIMVINNMYSATNRDEELIKSLRIMEDNLFMTNQRIIIWLKKMILQKQLKMIKSI